MGNYDEMNIDGTIVYVAFNMKAIFQFNRLTGVTIDQLNDFFQLKEGVLDELFYQGLKEGHRLAGKPFNIKKENVLAIDFATMQKYIELIEKVMKTGTVQKKMSQPPIPPKK